VELKLPKHKTALLLHMGAAHVLQVLFQVLHQQMQANVVVGFEKLTYGACTINVGAPQSSTEQEAMLGLQYQKLCQGCFAMLKVRMMNGLTTKFKRPGKARHPINTSQLTTTSSFSTMLQALL
jgi:hypothetical protein